MDPVETELQDGVAQIQVDDGKANALSPAMLEAIHGGLDAAEKDAAVALLVGRAGRFSAGFDLSVMQEGAGAARAMVGAGAELLMRLATFPIPVVAVCTGHALAAGALLLLAADRRFGASGPFKIGLNEVAIGMALPGFGVALAEERLSKRHLLRAVTLAGIYAPDEAVDAGYLDAVAEPEGLLEVARSEALALAGSVTQPAFRITKRRLRGPVVERMRAGLDEDLRRMLPG